MLGREADLKVSPVNSDYFAKEYFAPQPPSERLVTRKLQLLGANVMRDWRTCLREYLDEYYHDYL